MPRIYSEYFNALALFLGGKILYTIIGDIHGCYDEFKQLTITLGFSWDTGVPIHPQKKLVFIGDITDRGPDSIKMIELVWELVVNQKVAFYSPGNHCNKVYRFFLGRNVQITHGLDTTVAEYQALSTPNKKEIKRKMIELYESSPLYHILDNGKLITCHAGIRADFVGKINHKVEKFVLYGDITGEKNDDGTPVRRDWAATYSGKGCIVYGHTPVLNPRIIHNTYNIDTGCVFGGTLTALQYPEMTIVQVPSSMRLIKEKFQSFK